MTAVDPPPALPPPAPTASTTALAPGFRFHPTDEELVGYYLKRKVTNRPLRVDAISEIDLYKSEPWDLPAKSRIQSRDMEWYFFCSLDRKYANRSRTNRATGSGYWKTTGKDRPVRRNSRAVGMKKTLVYHVGRAPKGTRTNWVMHEYRLEDEELAKVGVSQDAYVVCRIFQKNGPGPQNGAQYGAPLVEEEWEEDDSLIVKEDCGEGNFVDVSEPVFFEMDDFEQTQDIGVQNENVALLVESDDGKENRNDLVGPSSLPKIQRDQEFTNGRDKNIELPELHDYPIISGIEENNKGKNLDHSLVVMKEEYLELNDFSSPRDAVYSSDQQFVAFPQEIRSDRKFLNGEISCQKEDQDIEEFFITLDAISEPSEPSCMSLPDESVYLEQSGCMNPGGVCLAGEPADDRMVYFGASSHQPNVDHGCFVEMKDFDDFMDSAMADSNGPDLVDELIAYFDATENLEYPTLDSESVDSSTLNQADIASEEVTAQPSEANGDSSASSAGRQEDRDQSDYKCNSSADTLDVQSDGGWDKMLSRRLVGLLGDIPSPPAFAAEYPMKAAKSVESSSAAHPSSSIHLTAGMIQINGLTVTGNGRNWSVQKNGDVGFLLSYGITRNTLVDNSLVFEPMPKMPGGIMPFIMRNGFNMLFLSVLLFAACYKIGVCIYTR